MFMSVVNCCRWCLKNGSSRRDVSAEEMRCAFITPRDRPNQALAASSPSPFFLPDSLPLTFEDILDLPVRHITLLQLRLCCADRWRSKHSNTPLVSNIALTLEPSFLR